MVLSFLETLVALQNRRRESRIGTEHRCHFKLRRSIDDILLLQTARLFWFIAHSVLGAANFAIMQIRDANGSLILEPTNATSVKVAEALQRVAETLMEKFAANLVEWTSGEVWGSSFACELDLHVCMM